MPQPKDWLDKFFTRTTPNDKDLQAHYGWQQGDTAYEWYCNGMLKSVRTPEGATIRFEYDALGRRTLKETHAIAMPGTATCCCMSGAMTGGSRIPTSLHGCMTAVVIHLWQSSPRRTAIPLFRTIWVRPYKLLIAREMWSGTAYSTSMGMYWNSEENETSYPSVSKVNTRMGKRDCTTTGTDTTRPRRVPIFLKTQ